MSRIPQKKCKKKINYTVTMSHHKKLFTQHAMSKKLHS